MFKKCCSFSARENKNRVQERNCLKNSEEVKRI